MVTFVCGDDGIADSKVLANQTRDDSDQAFEKSDPERVRIAQSESP